MQVKSAKDLVEGKYYILTGNGMKWSDFEGPITNLVDALEHIQKLCCNDFSSPEMINSGIICLFKDGKIDAVRDDNGVPLSGKSLHWKKRLSVKGMEVQILRNQ